MYNVIMDNASFEYLTEIRRALRAGGDIQTVVIAQLKWLGYKPSICRSGVYVDVGRGTKTLLCADAEGDDLRHTESLLAVARTLRKDKKARARLLFRMGEDSDCIESDDKLLADVCELYAVRTADIAGAFGFTYGTAFIGCMTLDVTFDGVEAQKAAKTFAEFARGAAVRTGVSLEVADAEYTVSYYDTAKGESVLMQMERDANVVDDKLGTTHRITAKSVYPPIVNSALCVDRVRSVAGELAVEVKPMAVADAYAQYFAATCGCLVLQSGGNNAAELEYELYIGLIKEK